VAEPPANPNVPGFVAADSSFGAWLVFPRDDAAMAVFRDGRWTIPPNPVAWAQMARLAKPLGIRRDPTTGLTAVIMSPLGDVFALCTPHQTEGHRSMYLSLFGRDLKPGETARAHARLVISEKLTDTEALKVYETYLQQLGGK